MNKQNFFGGALLLLLIFSFLIPIATAQEEIDPTEENECGIFHLGSCISEKLYEYTLYIINGPIIPLLAMVKSMLLAKPAIGLFGHAWSVVRYILSFFYIMFFIYAGFIFLTSYGDVIKRSNAKEILRNVIIMIILIQASFLLYDLVLSVSNALNDTILSMIDPHFFLITLDNPINIGLQLLFNSVYGLTLLVTLLLLVVRYIVVSIGVVFFPIGIFLYTIPPLRSHGRFILNLLGLFIFITFFDMLIVLACSVLIQAELFASFKIIVMIVCFTIVSYTMVLTIKFALQNMVSSNMKDGVKQAVKYAAMLAA